LATDFYCQLFAQLWGIVESFGIYNYFSAVTLALVCFFAVGLIISILEITKKVTVIF
jgi:hypothetical protein